MTYVLFHKYNKNSHKFIKTYKSYTAVHPGLETLHWWSQLTCAVAPGSTLVYSISTPSTGCRHTPFGSSPDVTPCDMALLA